MFTNNELKIVVSKGCRVTVEENPDGRRVFKFAPEEDIFKLVPASKLSLNDDFLKYNPNTLAEAVFMEVVKKVIEAGVQDFYRPTLDPSFDDDGRICYQAGMKPAVGKSYNWWYEHSKKYYFERKSRLGTISEYIAFLAVFIKEMLASGKSLEWAWNAVCNDSKELGHYRNSNDAKYIFEATGNREVCGWCDLANTYKILAEDKEAGGCRDLANIYKILAEDDEASGFWLAGGGYDNYSINNPLALLYHDRFREYSYSGSTGWLVFS